MELLDVNPVEDKYYKLNRPKLGLCYIINNVDKEQPATRKDVEKCEEVFTFLGSCTNIWYGYFVITKFLRRI